jgi:hypothetical protein
LHGVSLVRDVFRELESQVDVAFHTISNALLALVLRKVSTVSQEFSVVPGANAVKVLRQYFPVAVTRLCPPSGAVLAFAGKLSGSS